MRVLSLNVHHLPALVSCRTRHRAVLHETFREMIMTESPHVIMLQEAWSFPDELLTSSIPAMEYIAKSNTTCTRNMFPPRIAAAGRGHCINSPTVQCAHHFVQVWVRVGRVACKRRIVCHVS